MIPDPTPPPDFSADDWESSRRRTLTLALTATPRERLAWLEEMIRLAWASGALPRKRATSDEPAR
jgi:hypothetical protein